MSYSRSVPTLADQTKANLLDESGRGSAKFDIRWPWMAECPCSQGWREGTLSQLARDPSLDPAPLMKGQVGLSLVGCSRRGLTCCNSTLRAGITGLLTGINPARFKVATTSLPEILGCRGVIH
ncbi:MAG: hypothetical protein P4L59_19345 [Desulfosporosinus sp.]|nr:hypothetical protein [Desulfosporosinus sp.]